MTAIDVREIAGHVGADAIDDYAGLPRTMHRVTVAGDLAVGVDGSVSRAIAGDSAAYAVPA